MSTIIENIGQDSDLDIRHTKDLDLIDYLLIVLALGVLLFGASAVFGNHLSGKTRTPVSTASNR